MDINFFNSQKHNPTLRQPRSKWYNLLISTVMCVCSGRKLGESPKSLYNFTQACIKTPVPNRDQRKLAKTGHLGIVNNQAKFGSECMSGFVFGKELFLPFPPCMVSHSYVCALLFNYMAGVNYVELRERRVTLKFACLRDPQVLDKFQRLVCSQSFFDMSI